MLRLPWLSHFTGEGGDSHTSGIYRCEVLIGGFFLKKVHLWRDGPFLQNYSIFPIMGRFLANFCTYDGCFFSVICCIGFCFVGPKCVVISLSEYPPGSGMKFVTHKMHVIDGFAALLCLICEYSNKSPFTYTQIWTFYYKLKQLNFYL